MDSQSMKRIPGIAVRNSSGSRHEACTHCMRSRKGSGRGLMYWARRLGRLTSARQTRSSTGCFEW
jgi:hypothetical protein